MWGVGVGAFGQWHMYTIPGSGGGGSSLGGLEMVGVSDPN